MADYATRMAESKATGIRPGNLKSYKKSMTPEEYAKFIEKRTKN